MHDIQQHLEFFCRIIILRIRKQIFQLISIVLLKHPVSLPFNAIILFDGDKFEDRNIKNTPDTAKHRECFDLFCRCFNQCFEESHAGIFITELALVFFVHNDFGKVIFRMEL